MSRSSRRPNDKGPQRPWQLFHGDGIDGLIAHGPVDHSFLDPPYADDVEEGNAAIEVRDNPFGFAPMTDELRNRMARAVAMQTRRWVLAFCSIEEAHLWRFALIAAGLSYWRTGLWIRQNTAPQFNGLGPGQGAEAIVIAHSRALTQRWNGGGKPATWYAPIVRNNRVHPTEKPAFLMRQIVEDFTDEGEMIADICCGSGTTGVAAVGLGRRFVGWEIDEAMHKIALRRMKLPLFDRPLVQTSIDQIPAKGARARTRMQTEREVLEAVYSADEGLQMADLTERVNRTPREVRSALKRLQKSGHVIREGKTSQTRWKYAPQNQEQHP